MPPSVAPSGLEMFDAVSSPGSYEPGYGLPPLTGLKADTRNRIMCETTSCRPSLTLPARTAGRLRGPSTAAPAAGPPTTGTAAARAATAAATAAAAGGGGAHVDRGVALEQGVGHVHDRERLQARRGQRD